MEQEMIIVTIITVTSIFCILSYCVGYTHGFKKCKKIDDEIIEQLISKYSR